MSTNNEASVAEMQINFAALKKLDENINRIISTASSVAHYKFKPTTSSWEKTEVEGSLFVYSSGAEPTSVTVFIMNRLNKENFQLRLVHAMEFKAEPPFLLCKSASSEIIGIWFYDEEECRRISGLLTRMACVANNEKELLKIINSESIYQKSPSPPLSANNLMNLFQKAKEDYDKHISQNTERMKNQKGSSKKKTPGNTPRKNSSPMEMKKEETNIAAQSDVPSVERSRSSEESTEVKKVETWKRSLSSDPSFNSTKSGYNSSEDKHGFVPINKGFMPIQERNMVEIMKGMTLDHHQHSSPNHRVRAISQCVTGSDAQPQHPIFQIGSPQQNNPAGDLAIFQALGAYGHHMQNANHMQPPHQPAPIKAINVAELESGMMNEHKESKERQRAASSDNFELMKSARKVQDMGSSDVSLSSKSTAISNSNESLQSIDAVSSSSSSSSSSLPGVNLLSPSQISSSASSQTSSKRRSSKSTSISQSLANALLKNQESGNNKISIAANFPTQKNGTTKRLYSGETKTSSEKSESPSSQSSGSLMSPAQFQTSSKPNGIHEPSKEQLRDTLVNLLQNDDTFLSSIHAAFVSTMMKGGKS